MAGKNHELVSKREHPEMYEVLNSLISNHHPHLATAKIALVWRHGWKKNKDGQLVLGKCRKASDYDQTFAQFDFVILVNLEAWKRLTESQRVALLDHEMCHAAGDEDDETGEMKWRIRKHDLEEFREVVERHGLYKTDLEEFVRAAADKLGPSLFEPTEGAGVEDGETAEMDCDDDADSLGDPLSESA